MYEQDEANKQMSKLLQALPAREAAPTDYAEPLVLAQKALRLFGNEMALGRHHVAAHLLYQAKRHMEQLTEALSAQIIPARPSLAERPWPEKWVSISNPTTDVDSWVKRRFDRIEDRPVESPETASEPSQERSTGPSMVFAHLSQQDR